MSDFLYDKADELNEIEDSYTIVSKTKNDVLNMIAFKNKDDKRIAKDIIYDLEKCFVNNLRKGFVCNLPGTIQMSLKVSTYRTKQLLSREYKTFKYRFPTKDAEANYIHLRYADNQVEQEKKIEVYRKVDEIISKSIKFCNLKFYNKMYADKGSEYWYMYWLSVSLMDVVDYED